MSKLNKKNEKLITYTGGESCLYTLTVEYLKFLGPHHKGSLQPRCKAGSPNEPDPTKCIVYTLALSDLRKVIKIIHDITVTGFELNGFIDLFSLDYHAVWL